MNFAAYKFVAMPRGFLAALMVLVYLHFSAQAEALATDGRTPGMRRSCTAVATPVQAGAREGQEKLPAASRLSGFGVTKKRAGASRGRGTGIPIFRGAVAARGDRRAAGVTGPLFRPRGNLNEERSRA